MTTGHRTAYHSGHSINCSCKCLHAENGIDTRLQRNQSQKCKIQFTFLPVCFKNHMLSPITMELRIYLLYGGKLVTLCMYGGYNVMLSWSISHSTRQYSLNIVVKHDAGSEGDHCIDVTYLPVASVPSRSEKLLLHTQNQ